MAYKEETQQFDLFKRNTQFESTQGMRCCTCSFCLEFSETPKVVFKNFRSRKNVHTEYLQNGATVLDFVQDFVPSGQYEYNLDFDGYYEKNFNKMTNPYLFATKLKYFPFRNCTGSPTSFSTLGVYTPFNQSGQNYFNTSFKGWWDLPKLNPISLKQQFLNPYPVFAPYSSLFSPGYNGGFFYLNYAGYAGIYLTPFLSFNFANLIISNAAQDAYLDTRIYEYVGLWDCNTYCFDGEELYPTGCTKYFGRNILDYPPCPDELLISNFGLKATEDKPKPENPANLGDYQTLLNYIENNDFSFSISKNNSCENNLVKILPPLPLMNYYSTYQYSYSYPGYYESTRNKNFDPNQFVTAKYYEYSPESNWYSLVPVEKNAYYQQINPQNVVKNGYVLSNFEVIVSKEANLDSTIRYNSVGAVATNLGPMSITFSMLPEVDFILDKFSCGSYLEKVTYPHPKEKIAPPSGSFYQPAYTLPVYQLGEPIGSRCGFGFDTWWIPSYNLDDYYSEPSVYTPIFTTLENVTIKTFYPSYVQYSLMNGKLFCSLSNTNAWNTYYLFSPYNWYLLEFPPPPSVNDVYYDYYLSQVNQFLKNASQRWWHFQSENTSFVYVGNDSVGTTTDSSGKSVTTYYGSKFTGPTYLQSGFVASSPLNQRPRTSSSPMPNSYSASLSLGFECDIEIHYQRSPLCKSFDIPDKFTNVESLKITFDNYQDVPSGFFNTRNVVQYFYNLNPYDLGFLGVNSEALIGNVVDSPLWLKNYYDNWIFMPPNQNSTSSFYVKNPGNIFEKNIQELDEPVIKKYKSDVTPFNYYEMTSSYAKSRYGYRGRIYDMTYDEPYKNSLLVNGDSSIWKTGNVVTIISTTSTYVPKPFLPITVIENNKVVPRKYYCIFVKQISDNPQIAGQTLIKLASTYQDAIDGNPIVIYEYSKPSFSDIYFTLNVEYETYYDDVSKYLAPHYKNLNMNDYSTYNANIINNGSTYSLTGFNPTGNQTVTPPTGDFYLKTYGWPVGSFEFVNEKNQSVSSASLQNSNLEVISLNPLKIKYKNVVFYSSYYRYYYFQFESITKRYYLLQGIPQYPYSKDSSIGTASCVYGYMCDITMEENIYTDGGNTNSLPSEFNDIKNMVEYIQTDGIMYKYPLSSKKNYIEINPEKCTHIGKVIDRKDCNCPKKWIRQCEIHETTDWKKCMSCPNYQPED